MVLETKGKLPDAIALKDGKFYAVEIIPTDSETVKARKRGIYSMFHDVLFEVYGAGHILIRAPRHETQELDRAKLEISGRENRDVTWLELLKLGTATALAYGIKGDKKKR